MLRTLPTLNSAAPAPHAARRGHFLCIGLDRIDPAHYGTEGALRSAEADARDIAGLLAGRGFTPLALDSPGLLLRQAATRANVSAAIGSLAEAAESGDQVVLHYSGHGGQVPDESGDDADGLDETWCLYDAQFIDDELQGLIARFRPGVGVVVLSDSCHSGTVARARITIAAVQVASAEAGNALAGAAEVPAPVFRTLDPDDLVDTYRRHRNFYRAVAAEVRAAIPRGDGAPVQCGMVQIAACQDNQVAMDGLFNGLFSGTVLTTWNGGAFGGSLADLHREAVKRMPPTQTPNLLGYGPGWEALAAGRAFELATAGATA